MKSNFNCLKVGTTLLGLILLTGCNHSTNTPVTPLQGTNLTINMPTASLSGLLLGASVNTVLYRITGPAMQPVAGLVGPINAPANSGQISFTIPVPLGNSRLLAFQLNDASNQQPLAVGAVEMDFTSQPSGPIVVEMGSVVRDCYNINTSPYNDGSYFTFETDALGNAFTVTSPTGYDVAFLPVTVGSSVGFQINALNSNSVAYLGNGNLVQFAAAPSSGYGASSGTAKQVAGASVTLFQAGDVYCVKFAGGGHAWVQVVNPGSALVGPSFRFRVNTTLPYYAYEQTTIDKSGNCPGPLPTATAVPTSTSTNTSTFTATNSPTLTSTPTITATLTNSPTVTDTLSPTFTFTASLTSTPTESPTVTSTPTITATPTNSSTVTSTFSPTNTITVTWTPTITFTPTVTSSPTITNTPGGASPITISGLVSSSLGEVNSVQALWVILAPMSGGAQQAVTKVITNDAPFTVVSTAGSYNLFAVDDYVSSFNNGGGVPQGDFYGYYVGAGVSLSCTPPAIPVITGSESGLAVTVNTNCDANTQTPYITPIPTLTPTATFTPTTTFSPTSTPTSTPTYDDPVTYWNAQDTSVLPSNFPPQQLAVNSAGTSVYVSYNGISSGDSDIGIWTAPGAGSNSYSLAKFASISVGSSTDYPTGMTTDSAGDVYVADFGINQAIEFNSALTSASFIGTPASVSGGGPASLYQPFDVAVDGSGNVYVSESSFSYTVQAFGPGPLFTYQTSWQVNPQGGANYYSPSIAVNNAGTTVYVASSPEVTTSTQLSLYNASGAALTVWSGTGANAFRPNGIAVAPAGSPNAGNVYITDDGGGGFRVMEFDPSGNIVGTWGSYVNGISNFPGSGIFNLPTGIAVDGNGFIYVADSGLNLIEKFNPR